MRLSFFGIVVCAGMLGACGGGGGPSAPATGGSGGTGGTGGSGGTGACPTGTVCLRDSNFDPASLTVSPGTSVTFSNNSGIQHNVTFNSGSGITSIGNHSSGSSSRVFSSSGTFPFQCTIHAGMTGQIVVQ